jgi:6-phosphofructokinase 1
MCVGVGVGLGCAGVVDAVLIPEVPFTLTGEQGLYKYLEGVLEKKGHCVLCVAEGAGQVGSLQDSCTLLCDAWSAALALPAC